MNRRRLLLAALGTALVSAGLVGSSAISGIVPSGAIVSALGNDYVLAVILGLAALAVAMVVLAHGDDVVQTGMPDPESATAVPAPGDRFGARIDGWWLAIPFAARTVKRQARERLREDAVETLRRTNNCDASTARRRVTNGTWTGHPHAAAFLREDRGVPPVGGMVRATLRGQSWFAYGARRAATAVADLESETEGGSR